MPADEIASEIAGKLDAIARVAAGASPAVEP